ncbi:MAG: 3-phosphoshikimate 1-carboxyvinyltransferase [Candidatus Micrarchaeota archaeon]
MEKRVEKLQRELDAELAAPPSKAHSLRALFLASLAEGTSELHNPLLAADQLTAISCLGKLGAKINVDGKTVFVDGTGGCMTAPSLLDSRDSGFSMRALCSIASLAGNGGEKIVVDGSRRMRERPVESLLDAMNSLGARTKCLKKDGFPPVAVDGKSLKGGSARVSTSDSSQHASALLMALPLAPKDSVLELTGKPRSAPYLEITLQCMKDFGIRPIVRGNSIEIKGGSAYSGIETRIEGDFSSALFFFEAAAVCGGSVLVRNLPSKSIQADKRALVILRKMGCTIRESENAVAVDGPHSLQAVEADMHDCPDAVPAIAVACAFAEGKSTLSGIGHLRFKESDRLQAIAEGIRDLGGKAHIVQDGETIEIFGNKALHGGLIRSHSDHRIAMAFAVAGFKTGGVVIDDANCVDKSFPGFWKVLESLR